jgi:hypothetical protein
VEVNNLDSLVNDLTHLRNKWEKMLEESKFVGANINRENFLEKRSIRNRLADRSIQVDDSNREMLIYLLFDFVIINITTLYTTF